jgi:peptidyl-tRNA hydrolase, PTH1 family
VKVIFGIGNPGTRYQYNRHNVGFMFVDYLAAKYSVRFSPAKGDYYIAKGSINNSKFSLIKPVAYVNNSGIAALQVMDKLNINTEDILVSVDDVNFDFSEFRVKEFGGDGGHNGLASIIYHLNTNKFPRIRIGIGQDFEKGRMPDYVLSDFDDEEKKQLGDLFEKISPLAEEFILGGIKQMLNANSRLFSKNSKNNSNKNDLN